MDLIKYIEIDEWIPKRFKSNFPYDKIATKIVENLCDVHIKRIIEPGSIEIKGHEISKSVEEEFGVDFKTQSADIQQIFWKIKIGYYSTGTLKSNVLSFEELINQKRNLSDYESLLKIFFKQNVEWTSPKNNEHIYINDNKRSFPSQKMIFRWDFFDGFEDFNDVKNELGLDDNQIVLPFVSIAPIIPFYSHWSYNHKMYLDRKRQIEQTDNKILAKLYDELVEIGSFLSDFPVICFLGPTFTMDYELTTYLDYLSDLRDYLDSDTRRYEWE